MFSPKREGLWRATNHRKRSRTEPHVGKLVPSTPTGTAPVCRRNSGHYNATVRIHSSAPARVDLGGGTLDIWPLYLFHPGAQTVNVAIRLRAQCTVTPRSDGAVTLVSEDTGLTVTAGAWDQLDTSGENRLLVHIARFFEVAGARIATRAASPMGAGIAGSSALTVAVCAALARWQGISYTEEQFLTLAMNLEARVLGIPTGVQDYRPAMYGGISAVELGPLEVKYAPLEVDADELQCRMVLAYTGDSRSSGINNWDITRRHIDGDVSLRTKFDHLRDIAAAIRDALTRRDWPELAQQMNREWQVRQTLGSGVSTPAIEALLAQATAAGAIAGKVCGAGGGGCVLFMVDPLRRTEVCDALTSAGTKLLDCQVDDDGVLVEERTA
ncbi:MAG TPA: hypothetical protein DIU48_14665 [Acidobacteria bacterium]|nr:hypothetical protein [Acidobacteriota bacterium]